MKKYIYLSIAAHAFILSPANAQQPAAKNDVVTPLHAMKVDYPVPYIIPTEVSIKNILDKVFHYLDSTTPPVFINRITNAVMTDVANPDTNIIFKPGDFRLT